jgi:hypothetical protein
MMSDLLSEALARRSLTLFVGADLPQSVTGMPSRAELAAGLARRHGLDDTLPLAEVAQRVSQANNRWEFTEFICNALDLSGQLPQIFQQSIVSLVSQHKIETIITTGHDHGAGHPSKSYPSGKSLTSLEHGSFVVIPIILSGRKWPTR